MELSCVFSSRSSSALSSVELRPAAEKSRAKVRTPSDRKCVSAVRISLMLLRRSPDATTRDTASATCPPTRRFQPKPLLLWVFPPEPLRSVKEGSGRRKAGRRPKRTDVRRVAPRAKARTGPSAATVAKRGMRPAPAVFRTLSVARVSPTPPSPESAARRRLSVKTNLARRAFPPPNAVLIAISLFRRTLRAMSVLATLEQARRRRSPEAPRRRKRGRVRSPRISSRRDRMATPLSLASSG